MTKTDLKLEYRKSIGEYPILSDEIEVKDSNMWAIIELQDYINWLEDEYLEIRNLLGINERALHILKKMK